MLNIAVMKHLAVILSLLITPPSPTRAFVAQNPNNRIARVPIAANRILSRRQVQAEEYYDFKQPLHYKLHARPRQYLMYSRKRICLARPVQVLINGNTFNSRHRKMTRTELKISSGFTFDDGDQLLVSAQKPLGMVLEERGKDGGSIDSTTGVDMRQQRNHPNGCVVAEVLDGSAAKRAGVKPGDFLVAVQNADVTIAHFEEVMQRIGDAPQVVNLRFWRKDWDNSEDDTD